MSTEDPSHAPSSDLGDPAALDLLAGLVASAPTNLEDPPRGRYEKPNYRRTADLLVRAARGFGLATREFDPIVDAPSATELHGVPRPNVIVDLDVGAKETVLILAHYDVVPVPQEQRPRWRSPPHALTRRADGRYYGRGANDDLGSGVVASLLALKRLASDPTPSPRNVRLLLCCDEETGGEGGVEQLKAHDDRLSPNDPGRFLRGDVALIPDGSPHATGGSCGVAFLDATFDGPVALPGVLSYGERLIALNETARLWRSPFASPDWPDHGAPEPVITGRATLTRLDLGPATGAPSTAGAARLFAARAETDAANQIAEAVTVVLDGAASAVAAARAAFEEEVRAPYRIAPVSATSLTIPPGAVGFQIVGLSAHGGYPHRGHNPVPETLRLLERLLARGLIAADRPAPASFAVDLRLTPEMELAEGRDPVLREVRAWIAAHRLPAKIDAPPARCRRGYALAPDHPALARLDRLLHEVLGEGGVYGEYGGTDASSLATVTTPSGAPLPALVFGSMDRAAHIHEAEESVDPRLLAGVAETIYRFVREP